MHCRASMRGPLTLQQCGPQEGGRVCQAQSATSSASLIASARVAAPLNSLASSTISTRTLNSWREVEGGKQGHGRRAGSDRVRHGVSPVRGLPRQGRRTQRLARMLPLRCGLDGVASIGVDGRQPASWRSALGHLAPTATSTSPLPTIGAAALVGRAGLGRPAPIAIGPSPSQR